MNTRKPNVTLEDLLRVKRAERPPAEFWAEFEREMRVKELAAIVEPRPWWAPFIRIGARATRHQLPIGAAAILALSFVTVREYRTYEINPAYRPELAMPAGTSELSARVVHATATPKLEAAQTELPRAAETPVADAAPVTAIQDAAGQRSHALPLNLEPVVREPSPSARYIAANLAAVQAADPGMVDDAFDPSSYRRVQERVPVRDPLAQIATPGDARRSRLLTTALPILATAVSLRASDRVARRLTEDRLYDSISRVGVQGDRVAIKF